MGRATKAFLHLYGWEHGGDLLRFTEDRVRARIHSSSHNLSTNTQDSPSNPSYPPLNSQSSHNPLTNKRRDSFSNKRRDVLGKLSFWTEDYYSQKREREWMKEVDLWLMRDLVVREPRLLERVLKVARRAYLDVWV
ncbi:hypothetical protein HYFRA_00011415 [Hymenoscyphus fraxineus]|uniref:Uncharacterized protein n=1 Tax=Hymenoscyphus fraxineus TaxID=746836 RepID=A0A9N9L0W2_9HELO|nr:hypothetical protein HYFRA_00011415 [Hymenoscyphus fraxineus]